MRVGPHPASYKGEITALGEHCMGLGIRLLHMMTGERGYAGGPKMKTSTAMGDDFGQTWHFHTPM